MPHQVRLRDTQENDTRLVWGVDAIALMSAHPGRFTALDDPRTHPRNRATYDHRIYEFETAKATGALTAAAESEPGWLAGRGIFVR